MSFLASNRGERDEVAWWFARCAGCGGVLVSNMCKIDGRAVDFGAGAATRVAGHVPRTPGAEERGACTLSLCGERVLVFGESSRLSRVKGALGANHAGELRPRSLSLSRSLAPRNSLLATRARSLFSLSGVVWVLSAADGVDAWLCLHEAAAAYLPAPPRADEALDLDAAGRPSHTPGRRIRTRSSRFFSSPVSKKRDASEARSRAYDDARDPFRARRATDAQALLVVPAQPQPPLVRRSATAAAAGLDLSAIPAMYINLERRTDRKRTRARAPRVEKRPAHTLRV